MQDKNVVTPIQWGKTRSDGANDWRRRQARRVTHYSRFVIFLKVILPSVAAVLIGLVVLWPQLKAQKDSFSLTAATGDFFGKTHDQTMKNPRFFTVDAKGEPFNLNAEEAIELPGETRQIQLNEVTADVLLKNQTWFAVDAKTAIYTQSLDLLELKERVNLFSEEGYELETTQMFINLKTRDIKGNQKTLSKGAMTDVISDGFEVVNQGKLIRFTGQVDMTIYPKKEK